MEGTGLGFRRKPQRPRRKRLYSPQLHELNVKRLYQQAKKRKIPMTKLLNLIVCTALEGMENGGGTFDEDECPVWERPEPVRSGVGD